MKIRLMVTVVGMLLGAWMVASYLSPATPSDGMNGLQADAHRLGPIVEEVAALPEGRKGMDRESLFLLLTEPSHGDIVAR